MILIWFASVVGLKSLGFWSSFSPWLSYPILKQASFPISLFNCRNAINSELSSMPSAIWEYTTHGYKLTDTPIFLAILFNKDSRTTIISCWHYHIMVFSNANTLEANLKGVRYWTVIIQRITSRSLQSKHATRSFQTSNRKVSWDNCNKPITKSWPYTLKPWKATETNTKPKSSRDNWRHPIEMIPETKAKGHA